MATFLDTQAISNELIKLIKEANESLILISPYLKTSELLRDRIVSKDLTSNLKEFLIVYGKVDLKEDEFDWINGIKGVSLLEKTNLHAKAYINENRAIICSMNMHLASQQYNIEMGILITKKDDKDAYNSLLDEVNIIRLNGKWKKTVNTDSNVNEISELTNLQKLNRKILIDWRRRESAESKLPLIDILTDKEIQKLVSFSNLDEKELEKMLSKIKFEKYAFRILKEMNRYDKYYLGLVKDTKLMDDKHRYDQVLLSLNSNDEIWYDTKLKLPTIGKTVAVCLNKNWFNHHIHLD